MSAVLKNLVLFKLGWIACVAGAANGVAWPGTIVIGLIALEHLRTATLPGRELALLASAAGIGLVWESALVGAGLLEYRSGTFASGLAPYWIVAMWVLLATTLNVSLKWLQRHWAIAAVAGGLSGPVSFYAGERMGAVVFTDTFFAVATIAVGWAVLLPVLAALSRHFDGHGHTVPAITQEA